MVGGQPRKPSSVLGGLYGESDLVPSVTTYNAAISAGGKGARRQQALGPPGGGAAVWSRARCHHIQRCRECL
jgi:hypothetical protein